MTATGGASSRPGPPRGEPGPEPVAAEHRQLWQRAAALGVETRYRGADEVWRSASPAAVARVVAILEADAPMASAGASGSASLPVAMPRSTALAGGVTVFCPPYSLWRADDRDPSFGQLHQLCRRARSQSIDVVSTLPLNAAFHDDPFEPSPYSPVSRLHWNEAYVDPATIPGAASQPVGPGGPGATVDWRELAARRRQELLAAVDLLSSADATALDRWLAANPDVSDYARFRADTDRGAGLPTEGQAGPTRHRLIRSYELGQWLADEGLRRLAADPAAAGLGLDVPIGCHPQGFETRVHPELFAPGMHVGVPPDLYFPDGQDWGFPPPLPGAGRRSGHALWHRLVERVGRPAALLRIDHVMGVHRLWWIPDGHSPADGVFVRYPALDILAAIAEAATAADTTVVGENLGTVPPEVTAALAATATLGMHEEQFTMLAGEPPGEVPADTVAGIRTHDMDAFATAATQPASRRYAEALGSAGEEGADPTADPGALLDRVLDRLGRSPAYLVAVDLDDLEGGTRPHNVPGTTDPEGWSRRAGRPVDQLLDHPDVARRLVLLAEARTAGRPTTSRTPS